MQVNAGAGPRPAVPDAVRSTTPYMVQLKAQADLSQERSMPRGPERRAAVWEDLSRTAAETQPELTTRLDALKERGIVASYEPTVLANSILVDVPRGHEQRFTTAMGRLAKQGIVASVEQDLMMPGVPEPDWPHPRFKADSLEAYVGTPFEPLGDLDHPRRRSPHLDALGIPALWKEGLTGEGVRIGLLDAGFDMDHPALRGAYEGTGTNHDFTFKDFALNRRAPYELAGGGHGTGMASAAVGRTRGASLGVAPDSSLIAARIGGPATTKHPDRYAGWSNLVRGLEWMLAPSNRSGSVRDATRGADIVSISMRSPWHGLEQVTGTAVEQLLDAGMLVVEGAGNEGPFPNTIGSPSDLANVLTVGASDAAGKVAPFSSRGTTHAPADGRRRVTKPDLLAPGSGIIGAQPGGRYNSDAGTSAATPIVSGLAALLMGEFPQLDGRDVADVLRDTARDIGRRGPDPDTGHGIIDPAAAVEAARRLARERTNAAGSATT